MNFAYGWAFSKPVRKVYYNITITALSVTVAFVIGTIELLSAARHPAQPGRRLWNWTHNFNINHAGFIIVGLFVATWVVGPGHLAFRRRGGPLGPGRRRGGAAATTSRA